MTERASSQIFGLALMAVFVGMLLLNAISDRSGLLLRLCAARLHGAELVQRSLCNLAGAQKLVSRKIDCAAAGAVQGSGPHARKVQCPNRQSISAARSREPRQIARTVRVKSNATTIESACAGPARASACHARTREVRTYDPTGMQQNPHRKYHAMGCPAEAFWYN